MKIKNLMFLSLIFISLFSLSVLAAYPLQQQGGTTPSQQEQAKVITSWISGAFDKIAGFILGYDMYTALEDKIILIATMALLWILFYDAFRSFSPLSKPGAVGASLLLAIIAGLTKGIRGLAIFLATVTAGFGTFSVFATLIICFLLFFVAHLFFGRVLRRIRTARAIEEEAAGERARRAAGRRAEG